jgi:hypothetical protein
MAMLNHFKDCHDLVSWSRRRNYLLLWKRYMWWWLMTGEGIEEVGCITVAVLGFREQTVRRGATNVTRCLAPLPPYPHHVTVPL